MNMQAHNITKPSKNDYYWDEGPEPHLARRKAILKAHPEVKKLFGINPRLKYSAVILVIIQLAIALTIKDWGMKWYIFIPVAYFVGATIQQALFLAIHEITHFMAFSKPDNNNYLAFFANLPIVLPFAMSFKFYHNEHHWQQGKDGVDSDIPSVEEATLFRGFFGKVIWFLNQIFFYAVRPMTMKQAPWDKWQVYNWVFQFGMMAILIPFMGWQGLAYLLLGLVFAGGLHPTAGHFISEHFVFKPGQETYSYYGPLNLVTYNVGYHNEHHDFPNIPGSRLPELRKMAPEFYDDLDSYSSWTGVIIKFLFTKDVTLYSRTKRN